MTRIVTLARALPLPRIEVNGQVIEFKPVSDVAEIPAGTQVHCTTSLDRLSAKDIASLPDSVGLIANIGVGVDNIDLCAASERGILVSNTPVVTEDTADLAFALILAGSRRVGEGERFLRSGSWAATSTSPPLGMRVHGKTLGLVGFGAIAQAVARRAKGFGMPVRYWNRTSRPEVGRAVGATQVETLAELFATCDIVSVHTALTPQTKNLIGAAELAAARPNAVLVNTARGGIVDEAALCDALENGPLAAAGLDVFEGEPNIYPRLLERENVVLTPHIGSATGECRADMVRRLLANLVSFFETGRPSDPVETA